MLKTIITGYDDVDDADDDIRYAADDDADLPLGDSGHAAVPPAGPLPPDCRGEVQADLAGHEDPGDPLHLPLLPLDHLRQVVIIRIFHQQKSHDHCIHSALSRHSTLMFLTLPPQLQEVAGGAGRG